MPCAFRARRLRPGKNGAKLPWKVLRIAAMPTMTALNAASYTNLHVAAILDRRNYRQRHRGRFCRILHLRHCRRTQSEYRTRDNERRLCEFMKRPAGASVRISASADDLVEQRRLCYEERCPRDLLAFSCLSRRRIDHRTEHGAAHLSSDPSIRASVYFTRQGIVERVVAFCGGGRSSPL